MLPCFWLQRRLRRHADGADGENLGEVSQAFSPSGHDAFWWGDSVDDVSHVTIRSPWAATTPAPTPARALGVPNSRSRRTEPAPPCDQISSVTSVSFSTKLLGSNVTQMRKNRRSMPELVSPSNLRYCSLRFLKISKSSLIFPVSAM